MSDATDTIVLIHGLWMTARSWETWTEGYASRGYKVLAPALPGLEAEVESLCRDPTPLKQLDLAQAVAHCEQIIRALDGFKAFPGRSHFSGAPGWEEVARFRPLVGDRQRHAERPAHGPGGPSHRRLRAAAHEPSSNATPNRLQGEPPSITVRRPVLEHEAVG